LANKRTFAAIPRQQTDHIQGNFETHLDIRDRAMGLHQAIQHQESPNIPVKMLRMISSAPCYVSNLNLHRDFEIQFVTKVVTIKARNTKLAALSTVTN